MVTNFSVSNFGGGSLISLQVLFPIKRELEKILATLERRQAASLPLSRLSGGGPSTLLSTEFEVHVFPLTVEPPEVWEKLSNAVKACSSRLESFQMATTILTLSVW